MSQTNEKEQIILPPQFTKEDDSFRILSFNIAHGRAKAFSQFLTSKNNITKNCKNIGELLKTTQADFVLLQEIDFQAIWTNHLNQNMLVNADYHFAFSKEGQNNFSTKWFKMEYGNSVLSKHEILSHQNYPFEQKYMGGKGFQLAHIKWQHKDLEIINLHLHPYSSKTRAFQLKVIEDLLLSTRKSYIIGGDFNMTAEDPFLIDFVKKLNLDQPKNDGHTHQFLHWKKRLDYIFGTPDIQWLKSEIINTQFSDHSPLFQDFKWKL